MTDDARPEHGAGEEPVTAAEEAAAAELREALEGRAGGGAARAELEAAALIAFGRDGGALSEERAAAVLRRVVDAAPAPAPAPRARPGAAPATGAQPVAAARPTPITAARPAAARRRPRWWWAVPAVTAAAAAALLVVGLRGPGAALPPPPAALLRAQVNAAHGGTGAAVALEQEMRAYRERMLVALGDRYRRAR